jgi:membrane protein required for colicin V production
MTIFDYVVLGVIFISVVLSVIRGFVRESLSLVGWIVAFIVASTFTADFEPMLPSDIGGPTVRPLIAFIVLFISVLLAAALITKLLSALVKSVGLGFTDRFLGAVFGFIRGMVILTLLVLIAGLTALPQQLFWQQAVLKNPMEMAANEVIPWLPEDLSSRINFDNDESN